VPLSTVGRAEDVELNIIVVIELFRAALADPTSTHWGLDNDNEFRRTLAVAIVKTMQQIGIARATIARLEVRNIVSKRDSNGPRRQINVLYCTWRVGRSCMVKPLSSAVLLSPRKSRPG
jgi:hypothetical protein